MGKNKNRIEERGPRLEVRGARQKVQGMRFGAIGTLDLGKKGKGWKDTVFSTLKFKGDILCRNKVYAKMLKTMPRHSSSSSNV
jgi:hypothetical protein